MLTETELFEKAMQRFRNDDLPATSNETTNRAVRHSDEIDVMKRSVVEVIQNRAHSLVVQRTHEEHLANVLFVTDRNRKDSDMVRFEKTVDPALHMFRRLLRRNKVELVYDDNHRLVVNQLVQLRNDTTLESGENESSTGRSMMSHTYKIRECFLNGI